MKVIMYLALPLHFLLEMIGENVKVKKKVLNFHNPTAAQNMQNFCQD